MEFKSLAPHLHSTAEAAATFFKQKYGWTGFKAEQEITEDIQLRPTLQTTTRDHETICIEVSESPYSGTLDEAVIACKNESLPVKLIVVIPKTGVPQTGDFQKLLGRAKRNSVGIVEVDNSGNGTILSEALSLSLSGVRKVNPKEFPPKYRQALAEAESTFHSNPAKGCAVLYDEIENLSRKVAAKTQAMNLWSTKATYNFEKDNWAVIMKDMVRTFPTSKSPAPALTAVMIAGILAVSAHRNEVGHKPKSRAQLVKRNRELRTRFESAIDQFRDLVNAAKPLKV
jgi:pyruvate/2-oxoglutarate dehydrogenase complex dihydrolipoamide acyltransferase (E2) component